MTSPLSTNEWTIAAYSNEPGAFPATTHFPHLYEAQARFCAQNDAKRAAAAKQSASSALASSQLNSHPARPFATSGPPGDHLNSSTGSLSPGLGLTLTHLSTAPLTHPHGGKQRPLPSSGATTRATTASAAAARPPTVPVEHTTPLPRHTDSKVTDRLGDRAADRTSTDKVIDKVTDRVTDKSTDKVTDRVTDKVTDVGGLPVSPNVSALTLSSPTALLSSAPEWQAQFFKTKLCPFFVRDIPDAKVAAQIGETCGYNVGSAKGVCVNREACRFAHSCEELRPLPDLRKTKLCSSYTKRVQCRNARCPFAHSPQELRTSSSVFYKVTLCNFYRNGKCWNGPNCRFAHGNDELRNAERLEARQQSAANSQSRRSARNRPKQDDGLLPTPNGHPMQSASSVSTAGGRTSGGLASGSVSSGHVTARPRFDDTVPRKGAKLNTREPSQDVLSLSQDPLEPLTSASSCTELPRDTYPDFASAEDPTVSMLQQLLQAAVADPSLSSKDLPTGDPPLESGSVDPAVLSDDWMPPPPGYSSLFDNKPPLNPDALLSMLLPPSTSSELPPFSQSTSPSPSYTRVCQDEMSSESLQQMSAALLEALSESTHPVDVDATAPQTAATDEATPMWMLLRLMRAGIDPSSLLTQTDLATELTH